MAFGEEIAQVTSKAVAEVPVGKEVGNIVRVTGVARFIGSWLIMRLFERGYTVRATVRDPDWFGGMVEEN
ncbi:hypothetical protein SUGI_0108730 [Cryptomeria japonica]|nr:hypothetical protein SUGI_0108730 [Cryptomeria japonica]